MLPCTLYRPSDRLVVPIPMWHEFAPVVLPGHMVIIGNSLIIEAFEPGVFCLADDAESFRLRNSSDCRLPCAAIDSFVVIGSRSISMDVMKMSSHMKVSRDTGPEYIGADVMLLGLMFDEGRVVGMGGAMVGWLIQFYSCRIICGGGEAYAPLKLAQDWMREFELTHVAEDARVHV